MAKTIMNVKIGDTIKWKSKRNSIDTESKIVARYHDCLSIVEYETGFIGKVFIRSSLTKNTEGVKNLNPDKRYTFVIDNNIIEKVNET